MQTLGVSGGFGHNAAAALVVDGVVRFAIEEERLIRCKEAPWALPVRSIQAALRYLRAPLSEIDAIALSWDPDKVVDDARPLHLAHELRHMLEQTFGHCPTIVPVDHHRSHATAAFVSSGWDDGAVIVLDDRGEDRSGTVYHAVDGALRELLRIPIRDSLGAMYNGATRHLGFQGEQAGKTMGLAPYGNTDELIPGFELTGHGYRIDAGSADRGPDAMPDWAAMLASRFGAPTSVACRQACPTLPDDRAVALARQAQNTLEAVVGHLTDWAVRKTGSTRVALGGGVAMNCTNNGRLRQSRPDLDLFVYGPAGDAGGAIGAALALAPDPTQHRATTLALGCAHNNADVAQMAERLGAHVAHGNETDIAERTSTAIEAGHVGGWFRGRDEFGARALGNRSIIARADSPAVAQRVNELKGRESWRPLAPAFDIKTAQRLCIDSPDDGLDFMVEARWPGRAVSELAGTTHVDGSMRPLVVADRDHPFANVLNAAHERGMHALLNTSFNVGGEPIVSTPHDALRTFAATDLDFLAFDTVFISKPHSGRAAGPQVS